MGTNASPIVTPMPDEPDKPGRCGTCRYWAPVRDGDGRCGVDGRPADGPMTNRQDGCDDWMGHWRL